MSGRRRWVMAGVAVVTVAAVAGCDWQPNRASAAARPTLVPATSTPPASPTTSPEPVITYPHTGTGQFQVAAGTGPIAGRSGALLRYRVAVERDITGVDAAAFAGTVEATLGDPRSWTAGGQWRLQRVAAGPPVDFTVYLVTPATRDTLCGDVPDGYTSCRNGASVVLNVARWAHGVPNYGAPLARYREYMVNHETGHRLDHGHQTCPGPGRPAPVMQQQTLGLHGCVPNPWPYVGGALYAGPAGAYDDPIP
jgi:hypothetical protein